MKKNITIHILIVIGIASTLIIVGLNLMYQNNSNQEQIDSSNEILTNISSSTLILDEALNLYTDEQLFFKKRIDESISGQLALLNQSFENWKTNQYADMVPSSMKDNWITLQDSLSKSFKNISLSSSIIINNSLNQLDQLEVGAALKTAKKDISQINRIVQALKYQNMEFDQHWDFLFLIDVMVIIFIVIATWIYLLLVFIYPLQKKNKAFSSQNESYKSSFISFENKQTELLQSINTVNEQYRDTQRLLRISNNSLSTKGKELSRLKHDFEVFINLIHYELMKPIKGISLTASRMGKEIESDEKELLIQSSELMVNRSHRLTELVEGLKKIGGDLISDHNSEKVYLSPLISEVCIKAGVKDHIELKIQPDLPVIDTKKKSLEVVLIALLDNAIKFNSNDKPVISVQAHEVAEFIEFKIGDNGTPINDDSKSKIFNIFQVNSESNNGLGLGLTLAKYMVERYNGTIELETHKNGNIFKFTWPLNMH